MSIGCKNCYAEDLVTGRMGRAGTWGADGTRERTSDANWAKPLQWERGAEAFHVKTGHRRRVFCASLADVFEPRPELAPWRDDLFDLIATTPALDWLLLTKRPEEARDYLREWWGARHPGVMATREGAGVWEAEGRSWATRDYLGWSVLPNIWIGSSIENSRHTWRANVLREIPATVRFVSAEPLLGSLFDKSGVVPGGSGDLDDDRGEAKISEHRTPNGTQGTHRAPLDLTGIDWLIVGGESGGRESRPMHPTWARELRDACLGACGPCNGVGPYDGHVCEEQRPAFLFKQWGSWEPLSTAPGFSMAAASAAYAGLTPEGRRVSVAAALAVRDGAVLRYAGAAPTAGGKLLDGREWAEFPASAGVPVAA